MPPQAGETTLLTVFADVHYFFAPETQKPVHHRFEKASYVYIHRNSADGRGRIEVANNAGTPGQDAFAGALDLAHITYTYKKSTAISIALPPAPQIQQKPWQIPAFDLRHERKYMYPIHSIDLYLWTPEDAVDLVEALGSIESIGALDVEGPPEELQQQPDPQYNLSPVVQQLEQVAIGPQYKRESTSTTQSSVNAPSSASEHQPANGGTRATTDAAAAPAPLAYNPAAPPAPETRVHREKTPPPPDGHIPITAGVAGAPQGYAPQQPQPPPAAYPYTQQAQQYQPQHQQPYTPTPPPQQPHTSPSPTAQGGALGAPPGAQRAPSFPPPPPSQASSNSPSALYANPASPPPAGAPPMQHGYTNPQAQYSAGAGAGPQSPGFAPLASPGLPSQQQQQQQGYSSYSYATNQSQPPPAHNIHQQFYRPTESEAGRVPASSMPTAPPLQALGIPGQPQPQAGARVGKVGRVEKGVNRFIQRLEKF